MKPQDLEMLSRLLRDARQRAGLTQQEAAIKSDVGFRTYQRLENCELTPKFSTIVKICDVLGKDVLTSFNSYLISLKTSEEIREWFNAEGSSFVYGPNNASFTTEEIDAIKKLLMCSCSLDLSLIGYWEINLDTKVLYWCPKMKELYDIPLFGKFDKDTVLKRLSPMDTEKYFYAFDSLALHDKPMDLNHRVKSENVDHMINRKGIKMKNGDGHTIIYGIAYIC